MSFNLSVFVHRSSLWQSGW